MTQRALDRAAAEQVRAAHYSNLSRVARERGFKLVATTCQEIAAGAYQTARENLQFHMWHKSR